MYTVEKTTLIEEAVENAPEVASLFQMIGMHCIGCAMSAGETIEEACSEYGVDPDFFVEKMNEFIAEYNSTAPQEQ